MSREIVYGVLFVGKFNRSPLIIGGDFNDVLTCEDRSQGNHVTATKTEDFQMCIQDFKLQEVRVMGNQYTWTNNQEAKRRICSNIDRCFANAQWFVEYSNVLVERLDKSVSDHCPQLLRFDHSEFKKKEF